jgi:hypothetical protein
LPIYVYEQTDTTRVIYAYGLTDPEADNPYYHADNRGTTSVYLLDPPLGILPVARVAIF